MIDRILIRLVLVCCCSAFAFAPPALVATAGDWQFDGPFGGDIEDLVIDPLTPNVLYAGTDGNGIFRSSDGGDSWQQAGELPGQRVLALAIDPLTPSTLYAGLNGSGVARSTDAGATWAAIGPGELLDSVTTTVAIDPQTPSTLFAGTSNRGVFRTTDSGDSWSKVNAGIEGLRAQDLVVDPATPQILYLSATEDRIYRSTDGGDSWHERSSGFGGDSPLELAVDPAMPSTVYAGTLNEGLWQSTNGGGSWQRLAALPINTVFGLATLPGVNGTRIFAGPLVGNGTYRSTDGGDSWQVGTIDREGTNVLAYVADPANPDTLYLAGGVGAGVHRSTDGGLSWTASNAGLLDSTARALQLGSEPGTIWAGLTGDGVYRSNDYGRTWQPRNVGIRDLSLFYSLDAGSASDSTLWAGLGTGLFRSTDDGVSWIGGIPGPLGDGLPSNPEIISTDPQDPQTLLATTNNDGLYRSTDGGLTFASHGPPDATGAFDLVRSESAPQTLYLATTEGTLYKTTDGFETWQDVGQDLPGNVRSVLVDPANEQTVYAGMSLSAPLYKTTDGGSSWNAVSSTMLGGSVLDLELDSRQPGTLYAATFRGVLQSTNGGVDWQTLGTGIDVSVWDLALENRSSTVLYAALEDHGVAHITLREGCSADDNTLCLDREPGDARFAVTLDFDTALGGGQAGQAGAVPLAPLGITDGGILWFTDPNNPEVLVKVLDGCGLNDRFWVFYAATTTVGFDLEVTDTTTGERRVYSNEDLTPAATVTDTDAFATCSAGNDATAAAAHNHAPAIHGTAVQAATAPQAEGSCQPGTNTLCLGDGRFGISLDFDTTLGGGQAGQAQATPLAPLGIADGGVLAFTNPSNPEVLIKVLDGCALNGNYWVFFAAATSVGFELTVDDTVSGEQKSYINPDLTAATTVTDTAAFPCS